MKVGDIFVALGFDVDDQKLKGFDDRLNTLTRTIAINVAAVTGALYTIDRFTGSFVDGARAVDFFGKTTGQSEEELQRWIAVNRQFGISTDETVGSIDSLTEKLFTLKRTGEGAGPFAFLGAMPDPNDRENPFKVLERLRDSYKTTQLSTNEFVNYMTQLGLSDKFIKAVMLSDAEFESYAKFNRLTKEQTESLVNLGTVIDEFKFKTELTFADFVEKNKGALVAGIDYLYKFGTNLKEAKEQLVDISNEIPNFEEKATVAGVAIAGAWKPWLTTLVLIVEALADIKQFREENSDEAIAEREAAGQPRFAGKSWLAQAYNYLDKTFSTDNYKPGTDPMRDAAALEALKAITIVNGKPYAEGAVKSNTVNQNNTFNIYSSEDAESIANQIRDETQSLLDGTRLELNNGVER